MKHITYILCVALIWISVSAGFLLFIAFCGNILPDYRLDALTWKSSALTAILINLALLSLFGLQHSVMARNGFKTLLRKWIPFGLERMCYVLSSAIILIAIVFFWKPIPIVIWDIQLEWLNIGIFTLFFLGWFLVLSANILMNSFDIMGIRQLYAHFYNKTYYPTPFASPLIYRLVRHPMYLGFLIAFWATPLMTVSHLLFALGMTVYILIGIKYEERDMVEEFGKSYKEYQKSTPKLLPKKFSMH